MGTPGPRQLTFTSADGLDLAVDHWPAPGAQTVILLHGGGQTRHAWGATGEALALSGYEVLSVDLRGHGDSGWSAEGAYGLDAFADDVRGLMADCAAPPVLIGASLGGIAALLAVGDPPGAGARALVLVDITHRPSPDGAAKIQGFMTGGRDGFASLEEAADAVAAYLPHRPRPASNAGLMKNLRPRGDRLHWHWDPGFLAVTGRDRDQQFDRLEAAVKALTAPTLLVRGDRSEIVTPQDVAEFLALAPNAEAVEVRGASHMVAGDDNTAFGNALFAFLKRHAPPAIIY